MRAAAAVLGSMLVLSTFPLAASADDLPMPPPPSFTGTASSTPSTNTGTSSPDSQSLTVQPTSSGSTTQPAQIVRSCKTNGSRVQTCRYSFAGKVFRICTKKPKLRTVCRTVRASASRLAALQPGRRVSPSALSASLVAGRIDSGYRNPIIPAVVRLYSNDSPVPDHGWCSGSMILRGVVLTAAHCVWDDGEESHTAPHAYQLTDGWMQIAPGNEVVNGQNTFPYGVWNVVSAYIPPAYKAATTAATDISSDWALIVVAPDAAGRYPGDITGTVSATWGLPGINSSTPLYALGYPASGVFRQATYNWGENQYFCESYLNDVYTLGVAYWLDYACEMTGGASGGPVYAQTSDGSWTIVGVVNRGRNSDTSATYYGTDMLSIWMDDRFGSFYTASVNAIQAGG